MYLAIICFVLFAFKANIIRKKRGTTLTFSLYALYALSFLSTALMGMLIPHYCDNIRLLPTLYLLLVLFIWFGVFGADYKVNFDDTRSKTLANIMLIIMIPTLLYYLYYLRTVISSGLLFVDENIRTIMRYERVLPETTLSSITGFIAALYFVNIFLFYVGVIKKWGLRYNIALFVSSLSFPAYCLCFFGRDGIVLWLLNFLIMFLLFKNHFTKKTKKMVLRIIIVFIAIAVLLLAFITFNRFFNDDSNYERSLGGTLGYMGQQLGNFSELFGINFHNKGTMFPGFRIALKGLFGHETESVGDILDIMGLSEERNVFRFYVYTLITSYGYLGAIIVSMIFSMIIWRLSKKSLSSTSNFYFLLILMLYQIPMNGVFYYRQSVGRGDVAYAIGIVILLLVYKFKDSTPNRITYTNNTD